MVSCLADISEVDIEKVLSKEKIPSSDFPKLISPAAKSFLEPMAQRSRALTRQRFGPVMQLFVPMYLSNFCYNRCTYCSFSMDNPIRRLTLNPDQILQEARVLKEKGFDHILLLTGEAPDEAGVGYLEKAIRLIRPLFSSVGIEIQPLKTHDYQQIVTAGADSLIVYQETYHPETYAKHHLSGKKRNFKFRLDTADRASNLFYRITLGALLGLYAWQYEALALAQHMDYLQKTSWQSKLSISFPRIKTFVNPFLVPYPVTDTDLVQFICAFRLVFPDLGITMSTREPAKLRDNLLHLGITTLSAESKTSPGGYSDLDAEKQFDISDHRSLADIQALLKNHHFDCVMKDWDPCFTLSSQEIS